MSEQELREGLRFAVAEEPPLAFDPDRLMDRAERELRRRRSLIGVGAATAVIAAGAIAVPVTLHATGAQPSVQAGAPALTTRPAVPSPATALSPTTAPQDIAWPPAGTTPVNYTAKQLAARATTFTVHLHELLPRLLPSATRMVVHPWGGESSGSVSDGQNYLDTEITFTIGGVPSSAALQVAAPGQTDDFPPAQACAQGRGSTCTTAIRPDGSELVTVVTDVSSAGARLESVYDYRTDGCVVFATGYNYDATHASAVAPTTKGITVSTAQLTELATDPGFGL